MKNLTAGGNVSDSSNSGVKYLEIDAMCRFSKIQGEQYKYLSLIIINSS